MRSITQKDVKENASIIMELPTFKNLSSKEGLHNILSKVLSDIYVEQPRELFDFMNYELNDRMTETILSNYGIDKNYSKKVNNVIKRVLIFYMERLFQAKGSKDVLGLFAEIFGNFFEKINFYSIVVDKNWTGTQFEMVYNLDPISISDPENLITVLDSTVGLSKKYLMTLNQFSDYSLYPINTNLVYIQFSGGLTTLNNMDTFTNGVRAYAATSLQQNIINYPVTIGGTKQYIEIVGNHLELLISYFKIRETRLSDPSYDFTVDESAFYTDLTYDLDALRDLEDVLYEYSKADYRNRNQMTALKRRWQAILKNNIKLEKSWTNFGEMDLFVRNLYPELINEYDSVETTPDQLIDFYMKLYTTSLRFFDLTNDYLQLYVNTLFMQLITGDVFVETFFNPVFEIFIKYFFPVEMEYLNKLVDSMKIKDKWNAISIAESSYTTLTTMPYSLVTPQRGLDKVFIKFFMKQDPVWIDINDTNITYITTIKNEDLQIRDTKPVFDIYSTIQEVIQADTSIPKIDVQIGEIYDHELFDDWDIITNTSNNSENLFFRSKKNIDIISSKNETINLDSKQMVSTNSIENDLIQPDDLTQYTVNYGDYYTFSGISDYDKAVKLSEVLHGLTSWGYWNFQKEQKYTYGKYLYFEKSLFS